MPEIKTDEAEKNGAAASAEAPGTKDVKKNKKQKEEAEIVRFNPDKNIGLTEAQVTSRQEQGLVNSAPKKYSKTYGSIFFGNIFTFFNFLCVVAAVALVLAHAPLSQFTFVLIFTCNIVVAIVQEIRAKVKIDKLSILSAPTAKVLRNGKKKEIPVEEIVLDDVIFLSSGQQIPADCVMLDGAGDVNEALLTGESVPIKKA